MLFVLASLSAVLLAACAGVSASDVPTQDAAPIFTQAFETFSAEHTALAPVPTLETPASPIPADTRTNTAATGLPVLQSVCDDAAYVTDVSIPDGSVVSAGSTFTKTWKLQNSGACPWTSAYGLVFVGGDRMQGADTLLTTAVPSGEQADVSIGLVAPASPGTYTGQWQMANAQRRAFGGVITVVISVGSPTECKRSSKTTITIMGHAGPENTTIDYGIGSTVTDQHGDYAFQVPQGWSGTVTPSKATVNPWSFAPAFRTYSNVQCDLRNENYKATAPPGA